MDTCWLYECIVRNDEIVQTVVFGEEEVERLYRDARYKAGMVSGGCEGKDAVGSGKWYIIRKI